jgi:hypothetical protein
MRICVGGSGGPNFGMSNEQTNQPNPIQILDSMRSTLGELSMSAHQAEVDSFKGKFWSLAVECLVEKYGIKDRSISDQISEGFRIVLDGKSVPSDTRAAIQDALVEFRSEYNAIIS